MKSFNPNNNLFVKLGVPLTVIVVLSFGAIIFVSDYYLTQSNSRETDSYMEAKVLELKENITRISKKALLASTITGNTDFVRRAYIVYNETGEVEKAAELFKPNIYRIEESLSNGGFGHVKVHFHTPDGHSLYRSWTDKRGDDISSF